MATECFVYKNFNDERTLMINTIDDIVTEYQEQGYRLTTRQVYYQLVARGMIENTLQSYKRIASLINDAKLAGLIDWSGLEDRTRDFITRSHWNSPSEIIRASAEQYHEDLWGNQSQRLFVIIEKEALVGVLESLCNRYDVPLLAARGYPSGSVLYDFAQSHLIPATNLRQHCHILHLGDHDPSGIDMTRDLAGRLDMFTYTSALVSLERIALNMEQVEEINPPENPAKTTDSRFAQYIKRYGRSSWELDALQPRYLNQLVEEKISSRIDWDEWEQKKTEIKARRTALEDVANRFEHDAGDE
ncbi:hypothetical protein ACULTK_004290 [Yersinia enterocolitica]|uniref:hypothetical protein n=1 Tax=Yersinia TaxID=629 RepID=UPI001D12BE42|nr:hypothetical protein [Yersinia proxima]EKN3575717.1 hypothetical protein [Yersinia enterocolitica]HEN3621353.1 hypothetical protein [Yersinia enterocolitica]HEN3669360.1 hypothetical protein [Yersinia enterocolitica]